MARATLPLLLSLALGCGGSSPSPPQMVSVKGKVWLENEPINAGMIVFHPDAPPDPRVMPPTATIQPDGSYELMTGVQPGAMAGNYKVVIVAMGSLKGRVPARYTDPKSTELLIDVAEDAPAERYQIRLKR
jgi:hypothetical protein